VDLLAAFGFVLIIEGLMPMLSPGGWRDTMRRIGELRDGQIRFMGMVATAIGAVLLAFSG
jgi:uncharacterized protein